MIYLRVQTDDVIRVARKFEKHGAYLVAIQTEDAQRPYQMYFALED